MSTSVIQCKTCYRQIATKHHSGHITVATGVRAVLLTDGKAKLTCQCGAMRIVGAMPQAA